MFFWYVLFLGGALERFFGSAFARSVPTFIPVCRPIMKSMIFPVHIGNDFYNNKHSGHKWNETISFKQMSQVT